MSRAVCEVGTPTRHNDVVSTLLCCPPGVILHWIGEEMVVLIVGIEARELLSPQDDILVGAVGVVGYSLDSVAYNTADEEHSQLPKASGFAVETKSEDKPWRHLLKGPVGRGMAVAEPEGNGSGLIEV